MGVNRETRNLAQVELEITRCTDAYENAKKEKIAIAKKKKKS
jgi:hypothetical protein